MYSARVYAVHVRICTVHVCICAVHVCACVRVHEGACVRVAVSPLHGSVQVALGRCASGLHAPVSLGHGWEVGAGTRQPHVQPTGSLQAFGLWPNTGVFDVSCLLILGKSQGSAFKRKGLKGH